LAPWGTLVFAVMIAGPDANPLYQSPFEFCNRELEGARISGNKLFVVLIIDSLEIAENAFVKSELALE